MSFPTDPNAMGGMLGGLQQQMEQMKAQAAATEVQGQGGDGLVVVTANGALEIVEVEIDEAVMDDKDLVEDLVIEATNNAIRQAQLLMAQQMQQMMGGLGLPPGMF